MIWKYIFFPVTIYFCVAACSQIINAQQIPLKLLSSIPQAEEKLNSEDILQRISVLDKLIIYQRDYDVTKTILPFELSAEDYSYVVKKIFEKDLSQIEIKTASQTLSKIEFLIIKFQLREFAKNLADYIPIFEPNGMDFTRIGIQYGILGTLKNLKAVEFAPQIAKLLQPSIRNLYRETLSTLIELRAKEAIPALLSLLHDKNPYERGYALQSLAKVGGKQSAPYIAGLLNDENLNNRYLALDSLVKLNAKEFAPKIWLLVNSGQEVNTENYALAALVYFDKEKAIPLVTTLITTNRDRGGAILEKIVELKAKAIVPALINLLQREDQFIDLGENVNIRNGIISSLRKMEARESIPVLRSYLNNKRLHYYFLENVAATLGDLRAEEAADELLEILNQLQYDYKGEPDNRTYMIAGTAVALAKIGDKKAWKRLIDVAANPKFPHRSEVIQELNQHLNPELWLKSQKQKLATKVDYKSIKYITDLVSRETDIPVVLEFEPGKDFARRQPLKSPVDTEGYPWSGIYENMTLLDVVRQIPADISDRGTANFTFVFDSGTIRILSVDKAVNWWRTNILTK